MKTFTLEQVKAHNTESDCWLVIRNRVYDVTSYLDDHPGGSEIVTDCAGEDATEDYDDVGHSDEAHDTLEQYFIGVIEGTEGETVPANSASAAPATAKPATSVVDVKADKTDNTLYYGVAAAAALAAVFMFTRRPRAV